ncbi:MAG: class I SAM-dependent methyltransferase [bacterium]
MGFYAEQLFARGMDWIMGGAHFQKERETALAPAFGEVLEIGFGTGLNLPHYPEEVNSLTAVEPENMLARRVEKRIAAARMPVRREILSAEGLPFEDKRFDCVVSTWTLCTIPDLDAALKEAGRVLRPGGKFIFLEHGRSDDERIAKWQDRLNPIQKLFGYGCNMNRKIDDFLRKAGLKITQLDRFRMPKTPRLQGEMYRGVAEVEGQAAKAD